MDFSQYITNNALAVPRGTIINTSELVSFLQSNTYITKLQLGCAETGDKGVKALISFANLASLGFGSNKIDVEDIKALANGNLPNLTELQLSSNRIGDKGAEALANGNLPNLTELNLYGNEIGDEGAEALANGNLPNLTELDLSFNKVGCEVFEALARSFYVKYVRGDFRIHHNVFEFFVDLYYKNQSIDNLNQKILQ